MLFPDYNLNHHFDAAFVLTTSSYKNRHEYIIRECKKLNLNIELFFGVDGTTLTRKQVNMFPKMLHKGEVGTSLTHYNCWKMCLENNKKSVLFLEDDVVIDSNVNQVVYETMESIPRDWTVLHLGCFWYEILLNDKRHPNRTVINNHVCIGDDKGEGEGAFAYALSDRGMEYLVKTFADDSKKMISDGMINWLTGGWSKNKTGGTGYVAINQAFRHTSGLKSEIDNSSNIALW